jgi:hypothetical protein
VEAFIEQHRGRDTITQGPTLGDVVRGFKARVTFAIKSLHQVSGHAEI